MLWCVAEFMPICIWPRHSAATHWDRLKAKAMPGNSGFIHRHFDDVIYVRMQTSKIELYAALHSDMELVEIISDPGLSASSIEGRPGLKRVLHLVRTK